MLLGAEARASRRGVSQARFRRNSCGPHRESGIRHGRGGSVEGDGRRLDRCAVLRFDQGGRPRARRRHWRWPSTRRGPLGNFYSQLAGAGNICLHRTSRPRRLPHSQRRETFSSAFAWESQSRCICPVRGRTTPEQCAKLTLSARGSADENEQRIGGDR
jgi:hypothetical protein